MGRPFAIVTGASSGIGFELANICAQEGFDLLVAAETILMVVLEVCRAVQHQRPVADGEMMRAHRRRIGKPRGC